MRAFLVSVLAVIVIAVGALYPLEWWGQRQTDQAFSSSTSVRLPDEGATHNLVGKDWYSAKEH